jgi:hypothetical protein
MLWTLMVAITSGILLVVPIQAANLRNTGLGGYAVATMVGLLLAGLNAWASGRVANAVDIRIKHSPESFQERYLSGLYLGAFVWMLLAAFIGDWLTSSVLQLAF